MLFCGFLSGAGLMQVISTFWATTQPLPRAEIPTIPQMKEKIQGFHMTPIASILFGEIGLLRAKSHFKCGPPVHYHSKINTRIH